MTETTLKYWPKDKPIPDGWELARTFDNHHGEYSVLIREKQEQPHGPTGN